MSDATSVLNTSHFLTNWLGHRDLTRRVLAAFPEEDFTSFSIEGMRTPADLAHELIQVGVKMVRGVATGDFATYVLENPFTGQAQVLAAFDEDTAAIAEEFPALTEKQLATVHSTFGGSFVANGLTQLRYVLDNEIHHRGQLYVYLRALGIEPPGFYDRPGF